MRRDIVFKPLELWRTRQLLTFSIKLLLIYLCLCCFVPAELRKASCFHKKQSTSLWPSTLRKVCPHSDLPGSYPELPPSDAFRRSQKAQWQEQGLALIGSWSYSNHVRSPGSSIVQNQCPFVSSLVFGLQKAAPTTSMVWIYPTTWLQRTSAAPEQ